jgi:hypothetical protein
MLLEYAGQQRMSDLHMVCLCVNCWQYFHTGLPLRASCCWNGLTVIKAAPFKAGLKIRSHLQGECMVGPCLLTAYAFKKLACTTVGPPIA